jgi:CubicO group peptidase (beta-lactamase class C family)
LRTLIEVADLPGLSASVAVDGKIIWSEGFGFADVEKRAPVAPNTCFRTGSIAKPLSSAVIARLREEGKLDLDAPVGSYLPDLSGQIGSVTLRQLAGHLGGIRHYTSTDPPDANYATRFENSRAALVRFVNDALVCKPGAEYRYSTYAYTLLAAAAEASTEREFGRLLDDLVVRPLRLQNTCSVGVAPAPPNQTTFYERGPGGKPRVAPPAELTYKVAGGGLLSTSDDLVTFASALFAPGFLKQESLDLLFTQMRTSAGKSTGYGLGWGLGRDSAGRRHFSHGGGQIGCSTRLVAYSKERIAIAAMCNIAGAPVSVGPVAELFLTANDSTRLGTPPASIAGAYDVELPVDADKYAGVLTLKADGEDFAGELVLTKSGDSEASRRAHIATAYSTADGIVEIVLVSRENGAMHFRLEGEKGRIEIGGKPRDATVRPRK